MNGFPMARVAPEKADFRPALPLGFLPGVDGTHMGTMTYSEQLKHPNWQKLRLEVLSDAEWRCERCMDADSTLHVHHKHYVKGRMAWEYSRQELAALCETCHDEEHEQQPIRRELLARLDTDGPLGIDDFMAHGAGAVAWWMADDHLKSVLAHFRDRAPNQFSSGRLGLALPHSMRMTLAGIGRLLELLNAQDTTGFRAELKALLARNGVQMLEEES